MSVVDMVDGRVWITLAVFMPLLLWIWAGGFAPFDSRRARDGWFRSGVIYVILFTCIALASSGALG